MIEYKDDIELLAYHISKAREKRGWQGYPDDDYFLAEEVMERLIFLDAQIRAQINYKSFV